jgi:hypothetical protein
LAPADLDISSAEPELSDVLTAHHRRLIYAANAFTSCLNELHGDVGDRFLAVVYFDEAHTLQNVGSEHQPEGRNPYFALMHVLTALESIPIFFIFLSTNSSLNSLAPTDARYPSLRVQSGWKLIPPFFELPFDAFCYNFTAQAKQLGKLTLNGVCELEQMVKFGRPM